MVRQTKQTPEQKKESHKKKTTPSEKPVSKKPVETSIWPCTINGCNKQFAREADLKRHQRTTKLHSVPGFACPQCDARFTRTDALRRHQKSRHNGVVIDPQGGIEKRRRPEPAHSSGSGSKSRSISPSSKEKPHPVHPLSTIPPSGPQSYYRQHTLPPGVILPGLVVDGNYPPGIGLPTSATRLHQASWPPPWGADGSQPPPPHMLPPGFPPPYYTVPPHYYRPETMVHPSDVVSHHELSDLGSPPNGESSSSRTGSPVMAVDPTLDPSRMEAGSVPETGDPERAVIDPSLVSPSASSAGGKSGRSSRNKVFRLLDHEPSVDPQATTSASDTRGSSPGHAQCFSSHSSHGSPREEDGNIKDEAAIVQALLSPDNDPNPYSSPDTTTLDPPPLDMEEILVEDEEHMLNPADILTQESLASPPPS